MKESLREQLNNLFCRSTPEHSEYSDHVRWFDALVDFLRNEQSFPNQEINQLIELLWRVVGNKIVPAIIIPEGKIPSLSFMVQRIDPKNIETLLTSGLPPNSVLKFGNLFYMGILIVPKNFPHLVEENPVMQLGAVVYIASQIRDYVTGRLVREIPHRYWEQRAWAFEAEILLTLQKMAEGNGKKIEFNDYQRGVLERFPQGLDSLQQDLRYQTPNFFALFPEFLPSSVNLN